MLNFHGFRNLKGGARVCVVPWELDYQWNTIVSIISNLFCNLLQTYILLGHFCFFCAFGCYLAILLLKNRSWFISFHFSSKSQCTVLVKLILKFQVFVPLAIIPLLIQVSLTIIINLEQDLQFKLPLVFQKSSNLDI